MKKIMSKLSLNKKGREKSVALESSIEINI